MLRDHDRYRCDAKRSSEINISNQFKKETPVSNLTTKRRKTYYHVTAAKNVSKILKKGLKGTTEPRNRGENADCATIFVLDRSDEGLADEIARNQIWPFQDIKDYAVIEIKGSGVTGPVVPDLVNERTWQFQWMVQQPVIAPEFLSHYKTREYNYPGKAVSALFFNFTRRTRWKVEDWELAIEYMQPMLIMTRLNLEIERSQMRLADEQWSTIERSFLPSELVEYRATLEEKSKRKAARPKAADKAKRRPQRK